MTVRDYAVWFINLDRAVERRASIEQQLHDAGIDRFTRFEAVDAKQLDYSSVGYKRGHGPFFELRPGEVACFESHKKIWKQHDFRKFPILVVLEDDVVLANEFKLTLEGLIASGLNYDIVKLDFNPQSRRYGPSQSFGPISVRRLFQTSASSASYLMTEKAAQRLITLSEIYCDTLDSFITSPLNDLSVFQVFPAVSCQAMWLPATSTLNGTILQSTIDVASASRRAKGDIFFRLRRESKKLVSIFVNLRRPWRYGQIARRTVNLTPDLLSYKIEK